MECPAEATSERLMVPALCICRSKVKRTEGCGCDFLRPSRFEFVCRNKPAECVALPKHTRRNGFAARCEALASPRRLVASISWAVPVVRASPSQCCGFKQREPGVLRDDVLRIIGQLNLV